MEETKGSRTRLTEALGIAVPILSAPVGFVAGGKLAAAVTPAGGLGIIGGGYGDADWLDREFAAAGHAPRLRLHHLVIGQAPDLRGVIRNTGIETFGCLVSSPPEVGASQHLVEMVASNRGT